MNLNGGRLVVCSVRTHAGPLNNSLLENAKYVEGFFWQLIRRIKMKPLAGPQAFVVPPNQDAVGDEVADDGGLTMQCVISTSHIAYHSWPLQAQFRLVVDSCKDFSAAAVEEVVRSFFTVKEMVIQDVPYEDPSNGEAKRQSPSTEAPAPGGSASRGVEATA
jgi:hypothetical protein